MISEVLSVTEMSKKHGKICYHYSRSIEYIISMQTYDTGMQDPMGQSVKLSIKYYIIKIALLYVFFLLFQILPILRSDQISITSADPHNRSPCHAMRMAIPHQTSNGER